MVNSGLGIFFINYFAGDPTVYGNLPPHPAVEQALKDAIESGRYIGYEHSSGIEETRQAIAENLSRYSEKNRLSYDVRYIRRKGLRWGTSYGN